MDAVNRIFAYLNNDARETIVYSRKPGSQLKGLVDSNFGGREDSRGSTSGWVFALAGILYPGRHKCKRLPPRQQ